MIKKLIFLIIILFLIIGTYGQGYNHQWLLGSYFFPQDPKGRMFIDNNNYNIITELRLMPFIGTQGNISDKNGNLLMSSNGIWIANATNNLMLNGDSINPNGNTSNWPYGLPYFSNNVFLPYPGDTNRYAMFHHTVTGDRCFELYYSEIDMTLDNGLGGVTSKNNIIYQDTLNGGIGACRHANGRDWWVVMIKDSSDIVIKFLLTPIGITNISQLTLGYPFFGAGNVSQLTFSSDGTKFIATTYEYTGIINGYFVLSDFDRCTGTFSNTQTIQLTSGAYIWGLAFSPSGKYAYASSSNNIFQIDSDSLNVTTVATYDGFISPGPNCCATAFMNLYLAANGKIFITSGSSVQHLTIINYPDSAGLLCDVQQHSIDLQNYLHSNAVPNHPNYYLGCDTTLGCPCLIPPVGVNEISNEFNLNVYPNPTTNKQFNISYLLPQNKEGKLEVFDITGKVIYEMRLPQWSTLQQISLPTHIANGIYNCIITSGNYGTSRKIAIVRE